MRRTSAPRPPSGSTSEPGVATRVRKANRLRTAYEQLEWRIDALAEQEELDSLRPDLDGTQIMEVLGVGPGPAVGEAYRFLLERRLDDGPLGAERAREVLLAWWGDRT